MSGTVGGMEPYQCIIHRSSRYRRVISPCVRIKMRNEYPCLYLKNPLNLLNYNKLLRQTKLFVSCYLSGKYIYLRYICEHSLNAILRNPSHTPALRSIHKGCLYMLLLSQKRLHPFRPMHEPHNRWNPVVPHLLP